MKGRVLIFFPDLFFEVCIFKHGIDTKELRKQTK